MTEKAVDFARETSSPRVGEFARKYAVWAAAGLVLSLGASYTAASPAPAAYALAAGLSGGAFIAALVGGVFGALLHGLSEGAYGVAAAAIVVAARLIPDMKSAKLRAAISFFASAAASFMTRSAVASEPSELLFAIAVSIGSGVFSLCIRLLYDGKERGFDLTEPRTLAKAAVVTAFCFMGLSALDFSAINVGRTVLGLALLTVSARRGAAWCALLALPALAGICVSDAGLAAGAAAVAFSAAAGAFLSRYGKIARAAGFVLFTLACAVICGIDERSFRLLIETALAGALYAALPLERLFAEQNGIADSSVAALVRERLSFAADALAGISTGLAAAAETLDKKYRADPALIAERAADKACRYCPNNMTCWGGKYELFGAEFSRLVGLLRRGEELTRFALSPECAAECCDAEGVVRAITREYSRYLTAAEDERRVSELRRIYTDHLEGVRQLLLELGSARFGVSGSAEDRAAEKRAEEVLKSAGMASPQAFLTRKRNGRLRLEAYGETPPVGSLSRLGKRLIGAVGQELELPEITRAAGRYRVTADERRALSAGIGAYQLCRGKNEICGDCCDSFTDAAGLLYVVLSDGMGSGSRARIDAVMACSTLSKLLKCGAPLPAALEELNTVLMLKSADESFATLDICRIDLDSGECALYKAGAATTYIRSGSKLVRVFLSSAPAGSGGKLTVPVQRFSVKAGDVIIMATDGAAIDEDRLARELSRKATPSELAERIARASCGDDNSREDDISVVAVAISR